MISELVSIFQFFNVLHILKNEKMKRTVCKKKEKNDRDASR